MYGAKIISRISRISKIPSIKHFLSTYLNQETRIVTEYLVHEPLSYIDSIMDDEKFIPRMIKDYKLCQYFGELRNNINFKFYLKRILGKYEFQILEMFDDYGMSHIVSDDEPHFKNTPLNKIGFIYPCIPKANKVDAKRFVVDGGLTQDSLLTEGGHQHKFFIPRDGIFNHLVKFLTADKSELRSTLFKPTDFPKMSAEDKAELNYFNSENYMWFGNADAHGNYWHFKLWIIQFFHDITIYLLYKKFNHELPRHYLEDYYLPKESKWHKEWKNFEADYPWSNHNELNRSYTFDIQLQGNVVKYHFAIYNYKKNKRSMYYHYFIDIRDPNDPQGKIIYYRGSIVARNPITSIVFFFLSRTDEYLDREYPYIGAEAFRCILLQHVHMIKDWN